MIVGGVILLGLLPTTILARPATGVPGTLQPGFPVVLSGSRIEYGSPVFADVDLAPDDFKEIVVGGTDGRLYVYKQDGTKLWEQDLGLGIQSSPAVGDINNDGFPEIVVGTSGDTCLVSEDGGVYALDHNGNVLWFFKPGDLCEGGNGKSDGVRSSPALGDLDGNGKLDIVFGAWDHYVYVLEDNGTSTPTVKWSYYVRDTVWSSAALADINEDGWLEVVIGSDISRSLGDGGRFWVFDRDGNVLSGFPQFVDETIWSSPAVGDINGDGHLEMVVGTGFFWQGTPRVYTYDRFGNSLPGWPVATGEGCFSSPALADFEGDGFLEVVIGCEDSKMYAWHYDGTPVTGWAGGVQPYDSSHNTSPFIRSSPIVADYDDDGQLEILFSYRAQIIVMGTDGSLETDDGFHPANPEYYAKYPILGSPAIGDIDNDGKLEMAIGSSQLTDPDYGRIYVWEVGSSADAELPWPMFHRDAQHTGYYPAPPRLSVTPASLYVLHQYGSGDTERACLGINNTGDGSFSWAVSSSPNAITVDPPGGTVSSTSTTQIALTVVGLGTATFPTGTYSMGSIVITGTSGGTPVAGSPAEIPVTLYIGQVSRAYIPLVLRSVP